MHEIKSNFRIYVLNHTSLGANSLVEKSVQIDSGSDFIVQAITGTGTSRAFNVRFRDSFQGPWNDKRIDSRLIVGTADNPYILPSPRVLPANSQLYYDFEDTSGSANTIQVCLLGYEIYQRPVFTIPDIKTRKFRTYTIDAVRTASQRLKENIKIDPTGHFLLRAIVGKHTTGRTYKIVLSDSFFKNWSNEQVNNSNFIAAFVNDNLGGSDNNDLLPFVLPTPRFLPSGTTLEFDIEGDASGDTIQISLIGEEIPA